MSSVHIIRFTISYDHLKSGEYLIDISERDCHFHLIPFMTFHDCLHSTSLHFVFFPTKLSETQHCATFKYVFIVSYSFIFAPFYRIKVWSTGEQCLDIPGAFSCFEIQKSKF